MYIKPRCTYQHPNPYPDQTTPRPPSCRLKARFKMLRILMLLTTALVLTTAANTATTNCPLTPAQYMEFKKCGALLDVSICFRDSVEDISAFEPDVDPSLGRICGLLRCQSRASSIIEALEKSFRLGYRSFERCWKVGIHVVEPSPLPLPVSPESTAAASWTPDYGSSTSGPIVSLMAGSTLFPVPSFQFRIASSYSPEPMRASLQSPPSELESTPLSSPSPEDRMEGSAKDPAEVSQPAEESIRYSPEPISYSPEPSREGHDRRTATNVCGKASEFQYCVSLFRNCYGIWRFLIWNTFRMDCGNDIGMKESHSQCCIVRPGRGETCFQKTSRCLCHTSYSCYLLK